MSLGIIVFLFHLFHFDWQTNILFPKMNQFFSPQDLWICVELSQVGIKYQSPMYTVHQNDIMLTVKCIIGLCTVFDCVNETSLCIPQVWCWSMFLDTWLRSQLPGVTCSHSSQWWIPWASEYSSCLEKPTVWTCGICLKSFVYDPHKDTANNLVCISV